jgi:hypothetical protein
VSEYTYTVTQRVNYWGGVEADGPEEVMGLFERGEWDDSKNSVESDRVQVYDEAGKLVFDTQPNTVTILITHDENALHASVHDTAEEGLEELRQYLNGNPVDYQEPLPKGAPRDKIEWAANDRSQFSWSLLEQKAPGDVL